ncbi:MAG: hypothetical protein QME49_02395 [bacterium]|nr:hypothetical protein [bacterium]
MKLVLNSLASAIASMDRAFSESDLPFRVDVLDWHVISPEFKGVIEAGYEVIVG